MRYAATAVILWGLLCSGVYAGEEKRYIKVDTAYFSIDVPKSGWVVRRKLPPPYLLALISEIEGEKDIFTENILIYRVKLSEKITPDQVVKDVSSSAKQRRPDFKVVEDTKAKAGDLDVRRQVCTMTFPEFVSKNIQYFVEKEGYVYVLTASIPESVFKKWVKVFDHMVGSFRVKSAKASDDGQKSPWRMLMDEVNVYFQQGRFSEAARLAEQALNVSEKSFGTNHPKTALSKMALGRVYQVQSKYAEAESLYKEALAISELSLGKDHHYVAISKMALGSLCQSQGKYEEAESLYKEALAISELSLGKDHHYVATVLENMAECYREMGKKDQAEKLESRAKEIRSKE